MCHERQNSAQLELMFGLVELDFRFGGGGIWFVGEGGIFLHISSSWVKFRLHTKIWLCTLPGSALKVPVEGG